MVDRTNLQQVNMLYGELGSIDLAERGFDNGGVIVGMEVSPGPMPEPQPGEPPRPPPSGIRVATDRIAYPQQMVDAIKAAFAQRRREIESELEGLGLTGVDRR